MTIDELNDRIARWEDLRTEFKEWPVRHDRLAATLTAFANSDGGDLVLGVREGGNIVGIDDADIVMREVDNAAFNNCVPPVSVEQDILTTPTGTVIVAHVPRGAMRPYSTRKGGTIYLRTSSGRRPASREEILRLYQASGSLHYDEQPMLKLTIADLDLDAFENYLKDNDLEDLHDSREQLLVNWRLLSEDGHPTLAGCLLFGRHPQRHLPFADISAIRFAGPDESYEPLDRKDLQGRMLEIIDQAERFIDLHLPRPHRIRNFEPEAKQEIPRVALREVIVNAVAHRDYTVAGPIRLFIFDDRIEVHTPGRPPNSVDENAMRAGFHVPRNPAIYARLADAGLVTRAGSGIRRMIRLVREATGREVGIEIRNIEVVVTIPRKI